MLIPIWTKCNSRADVGWIKTRHNASAAAILTWNIPGINTTCWNCHHCVLSMNHCYSVISMPNPPTQSTFVPDPTLIQTKYLHQTLPRTYTVLHIRHSSSLPPFFCMLYLLLVSSLSIVYLWPFIITTLSHMSSFATILPPHAFSISCLYPHALHTFPYAPPYLHPIPNLIVIVYKSSVLRLCTSVCISTKSPILLLEVPLRAPRSSLHLCTPNPLKSRTTTSTRAWHTSLRQVLIKSPLSYLRQASGPPL